MSCSKHKQRKRQNCPDCQAELNPPKVILDDPRIIDKVKKQEVILNNIKEKKKIQEDKIIITSTPTGESEFYKEFTRQSLATKEYIDELVSQIPDEIKKAIDEYWEEKFKKIKQEINSITTIKYEYKWIPEGSFRVSMIDSEAKAGWRYKEIFKGEILKTYGLKEPSVLFERIKQ